MAWGRIWSTLIVRIGSNRQFGLNLREGVEGRSLPKCCFRDCGELAEAAPLRSIMHAAGALDAIINLMCGRLCFDGGSILDGKIR